MSDMIELLEEIAQDNDLLLSDNLIRFAGEVWKIAYNEGRKYQAQEKQDER